MIHTDTVVSAAAIDHVCLMIVRMMLLHDSICLSCRYMIVTIAIINTSTITVNACIGYMAVVTAIESFLAIESVVIATTTMTTTTTSTSTTTTNTITR